MTRRRLSLWMWWRQLLLNGKGVECVGDYAFYRRFLGACYCGARSDGAVNIMAAICEFINRWQTLIAGAFTFGAIWATLVSTKRQLEFARSESEKTMRYAEKASEKASYHALLAQRQAGMASVLSQIPPQKARLKANQDAQALVAGLMFAVHWTQRKINELQRSTGEALPEIYPSFALYEARQKLSPPPFFDDLRRNIFYSKATFVEPFLSLDLKLRDFAAAWLVSEAPQEAGQRLGIADNFYKDLHSLVYIALKLSGLLNQETTQLRKEAPEILDELFDMQNVIDKTTKQMRRGDNG
jgi:hypothetical protein